MKNNIGWENFEKFLKIFDKNSIEKLNFNLFLGKFVAKNRVFGNNITFLQQFFPVRGGGLNPLNPLRTPLIYTHTDAHVSSMEKEYCN